MKRANLLLADRSSSGSKMTTTGHSTPSGSTRTKAAKGLFSHFMFLASLLLITLLTSGKALAQETYTVAMNENETACHIKAPAEAIAIAEHSFTLEASTGYKLPTDLDKVILEGQELKLGEGAEENQYTYKDGVVTISSGTRIAAGNTVTITATGVELKNITTLKSLTYEILGESPVDVPGFTANAAAGTFTVELQEYTNKNIKVTGVVTDGSEASVSEPVTVSAADAVASGATITVTPEDQSKPVANYVVMFTIPKDKLDAITVPGALTGLKLASRMTEDEVLAHLGKTYATFDITTEGEQEGLSLDVVWTLKSGNQFDNTPEGTNDFTWSVEEAFADAGLDQNGKNLTGDVTITNADAAVTTAISSLSYVIDGKKTEITEGLTEATIDIVLPYETKLDEQFTLTVACKDNATAKVQGGQEIATEFPITLDAGEKALALVITAEDEKTTSNVTINFTIEEELVTAVSGVPANYTLSAAVADENEAIALLNTMDMTGITLTANSKAPLKLEWAYKGGDFNNASGQSNNFTWTVVKENGSAITAKSGVTATGTTSVTNYTVSTEAGISALTYQIAGGSIETIDPVKEASSTNDVTVAYGTKSITVSITPTDAKATVSLTDTPEDHGTLVDGVTSYETPVIEEFKFTITAEDKTTTKNFIIKFTVDKEKITAVTVPATYKLPETVTDAKAAIALLADMEGVIIKTNGTTPTKLDWTYDKAQNGTNEYTAEGGKTNVFTWSAVRDDDGEALDAASGVTITGTTTVTNFMEPVTGNTPEKEVEVTTEKPIDKIGDGSTPTIVKSVEIADDVTTDQLTINKADIKEKLNLQGSVKEVVLNEATIPEVVLAKQKTTTLILQSGNQIKKITNAGTLTLQDAEAPAVATQSMALETRAGLTNNGAVGAVENNGVFTDKTATIVVVGGNADLSLTSQPKNQSTYGQEATLAVVAETTTDEAITYQWQKNIGGVWTNANGTGNNEATLTVGKTGDGAGSFRCKVVSTNSGASTTLYTQTATVTFLTESGPSEPSNPSTPTYTVSLDKVAGATFSKGETTTVDEGDNFSFKITLDKDYDQSQPVVTVDGKAITADADGNYTIKNIQKDIKIIVSGIVKNTATGIEENVADAARVWSVGSTLYIHVPETADVYVVSGTGALQQQLRGVSGDYNMQLRAGFYIVRIGNVSQKVIIR